MVALIIAHISKNLVNCNSTNEYMFLIGLVPVHLKDGETVIWKNETPSSSLYCRPIKFIFCKESPLLVKNEKKSTFKNK